MAGDDAEKTEDPTPKRLKEAKKEGQFPRTPDAATWVSIAAGFALVPKSISITTGEVRRMLDALPAVAQDPTPARALGVLGWMPMAVLKGAAPVCLAAMLGVIAAMAAQGVHPSTTAMKPKFSRMNPKEGLKRMFGVNAAWEALKAVSKVAVIATVLYLIARTLIPELTQAGTLPLSTTVARAQSGLKSIIWAAAGSGLALAGADYFYQRHKVMKQLKMSRKEIKDEFKQVEGDPHIKQAIRQKQMAMSRNRMMAAVATADVVLVNPTHIAVALKYAIGRGAPRVIAKGSGDVAQKIKDIAKENRIAVVEDKPLARTLYQVCEVNDEIPSELYVAVAQILAFVMRAGRPSSTAGVKKPPVATKLPEQMPSRNELRLRRIKEEREAKSASR